MADDTSKVVIPSTGEIYKMATGTAAPTSAISSLTAWTGGLLGFLSEDGVTQHIGSTTTKIKAFQNATVVRVAQTEFEVTYEFAMLELNPNTLAAYYGDYTAADATAGLSHISATTLGHYAYIIDMVDSLQKVRIYIPDGQITDRGDTTFKNGEATVLPVTITAYPDASGYNAYKWTDHDITVSS